MVEARQGVSKLDFTDREQFVSAGNLFLRCLIESKGVFSRPRPVNSDVRPAATLSDEQAREPALMRKG